MALHSSFEFLSSQLCKAKIRDCLLHLDQSSERSHEPPDYQPKTPSPLAELLRKRMPLPVGWTALLAYSGSETVPGTTYFEHVATGDRTWNHPTTGLDEYQIIATVQSDSTLGAELQLFLHAKAAKHLDVNNSVHARVTSGLKRRREEVEQSPPDRKARHVHGQTQAASAEVADISMACTVAKREVVRSAGKDCRVCLSGDCLPWRSRLDAARQSWSRSKDALAGAAQTWHEQQDQEIEMSSEETESPDSPCEVIRSTCERCNAMNPDPRVCVYDSDWHDCEDCALDVQDHVQESYVPGRSLGCEACDALNPDPRILVYDSAWQSCEDCAEEMRLGYIDYLNEHFLENMDPCEDCKILNPNVTVCPWDEAGGGDHSVWIKCVACKDQFNRDYGPCIASLY